MCRGTKKCTELGVNPRNWSELCPLSPPTWFEEQLDIFRDAVTEFTSGNRKACIAILSGIRSAEMRDWYIEHGQMSGIHRARVLGLPAPVPLEISCRDPVRSPKKYEAKVFLRDGFRCRYCGTRLISNEVLNGFAKALNSPEFRKGPRNMDTHGVICIFNPAADHVIPWNLGGKTDMDNLVASCGSCNYGKDRFTIEQIGIQSPLNRSPIIGDWDGLIHQLGQIRRMAE